MHTSGIRREYVPGFAKSVLKDTIAKIYFERARDHDDMKAIHSCII